MNRINRNILTQIELDQTFCYGTYSNITLGNETQQTELSLITHQSSKKHAQYNASWENT